MRRERIKWAFESPQTHQIGEVIERELEAVLKTVRT
jgi:hypothetical protein